MPIKVKTINLKARTVGRVKREVRVAVNPFYGTKTAGRYKDIKKHGLVGSMVVRQQRREYRARRKLVSALTLGIFTYSKKRKPAKKSWVDRQLSRPPLTEQQKRNIKTNERNFKVIGSIAIVIFGCIAYPPVALISLVAFAIWFVQRKRRG